MRTTLTLEKDVVARLKAEVRISGRSFKDVVNECLRSGLTQRHSVRRSAPFVVNSRDLGRERPGVSLDNIGELLQQVEGPDRT